MTNTSNTPQVRASSKPLNPGLRVRTGAKAGGNSGCPSCNFGNHGLRVRR